MKQINIDAQHSTLQFNLYERFHYIYKDQDNINYKSKIRKENHDLQSKFNEYINNIRYKQSNTFIRHERK